MDERVPVAGRLRRPGWRDPRLLVGVLLMAVAIVGVAGIVGAADRTEAHYAARATLTPGTVLGPDDVAIAHVRVEGGRYLQARDDAAPWGQVVTRVVEEGELMPSSALAEPDAYDGRPVAVVTTSPVAPQVEPGSVVDVWVTSAHGDAAPQSTVIGEGLVVSHVEDGDRAFGAGGGETVYVVVPGDALGGFLEALASDGDVAVVARASES